MKEFEGLAKMDSLRHILSMAVEEMIAAETETEVRQRLFIVLEELYNNVALHAYKQQATPGIVRIKLQADQDVVHLHVEDQGVEFNLLEHDDAKRVMNIDLLEEGGEGVFLVKTLSSSVTYERVGKWNKVDVIITA